MFIGTKDLTYIYMPGTPFAAEALSGVSFSLERGDFAVLIGPSGSGKSTLIQHLNGLLSPTQGKVFFNDQDIGADKKELLFLRRKIGLVFQMPEEQFFSETVFDEVAFAPRNLDLAGEEIAARVNSALALVGLDPDAFKARHPFRLSSGQKRLVAIAAVLSLHPEVLVLDEPTAGLDISARSHLFALLRRLNADEGLTVLVSTHHLDEAAALANRAVVLNRGRLVMCGPAGDVFQNRVKLKDIGLALPPVTGIMDSLCEEGMPVRTDIFDLQSARLEILLLKGRL